MKKRILASLIVAALLLPSLFTGGTAYALSMPKSYRTLVENDRFSIGLNTSNCFFAILDKEANQLYESNPSDWKSDKKAAGGNKTRLQSQLSITVLRASTENTETINSQAGSVSKGTVKLLKIDNGLVIKYTFEGAGIMVPLYVTIEEDHFKIYVPKDEIEETGEDRLMEIELAPLFACSGKKDNGYILVPDGSGSLIFFNNGKGKAGTYRAQVYGSDRTFSGTIDNNTMQRAALPVFGMNYGDYGLLAVATEGDEHAYISAAVSDTTNSYNSASFSFSVRSKGEYTIGEENYNSRTVNLYQKERSASGRYEVSFYPLKEGACDYIAMADKYASLLFGDRKDASQPRVNLSLYGMIYKTKPLLGIPINTAVPLASYEKADSLINDMYEAGIKTSIEYLNWNVNSARNRMGGIEPSSILGGDKAFDALLENAAEKDAKIFFGMDPLSFTSDGALITQFTHAALALSSFPVKLNEYMLTTHKADESIDHKYALRESRIEEYSQEIHEAFSALSINAAFGNAASFLYSDYSREDGSRENIYQAVKRLYESAPNEVLSSWPNAYALKDTDYVKDVPSSSSRTSLSNAAVPFYAYVLRGRVPFSVESVNLSDEPRAMLLYAAETGADLNFTLILENAQEVRYSDYNELYGCDYDAVRDMIFNMQKELDEARRLLDGRKILSRVEEKELVTVLFEGGYSLVLNYGFEDLSVNGETIPHLAFRIFENQDEKGGE